MKLKIDFNGVNLLLTRSKQRQGDTCVSPVLSITKGGATTLNQAFTERFYKSAPKSLYYQFGTQGEDYYLFVSKDKKEGFYTLNKATKGVTYLGRSMEARKALGKKGKVTWYDLTPVKVENAKLKGFKLNLRTGLE